MITYLYLSVCLGSHDKKKPWGENSFYGPLFTIAALKIEHLLVSDAKNCGNLFGTPPAVSVLSRSHNVHRVVSSYSCMSTASVDRPAETQNGAIRTSHGHGLHYSFSFKATPSHLQLHIALAVSMDLLVLIAS